MSVYHRNDAPYVRLFLAAESDMKLGNSRARTPSVGVFCCFWRAHKARRFLTLLVLHLHAILGTSVPSSHTKSYIIIGRRTSLVYFIPMD